MKSINKKLNEIFLGSVLSSPSFELKKGIIKAPTKGSKIIENLEKGKLMPVLMLGLIKEQNIN